MSGDLNLLCQTSKCVQFRLFLRNRRGSKGRQSQTLCQGRWGLSVTTPTDLLSNRYYKANDVCKFRYDRPFHRGEKRKDCEIAVSLPPPSCSMYLTSLCVSPPLPPILCTSPPCVCVCPQTLWLDRTNFITTNSFPGEMAWFEVASMEEVHIFLTDCGLQ